VRAIPRRPLSPRVDAPPGIPPDVLTPPADAPPGHSAARPAPPRQKPPTYPDFDLRSTGFCNFRSLSRPNRCPGGETELGAGSAGAESSWGDGPRGRRGRKVFPGREVTRGGGVPRQVSHPGRIPPLVVHPGLAGIEKGRIRGIEGRHKKIKYRGRLPRLTSPRGVPFARRVYHPGSISPGGQPPGHALPLLTHHPERRRKKIGPEKKN